MYTSVDACCAGAVLALLRKLVACFAIGGKALGLPVCRLCGVYDMMAGQAPRAKGMEMIGCPIAEV